MSERKGAGVAEAPGGLEIRPCREEHYPDVFDLYDRAWPGDVERRKSAFRWLHDGNPFKDPQRSYLLAYQDGVLAGYWGRMPVRFYHRGKPFTYVFCQEALVDPAFRRRGIARRLMEEAVESPDLYLSLWHNEKIVSLLQSHGWESPGRYRPRRKIYRTDNLVRWKVRNPLARRLMRPLAAMTLALRRSPRVNREAVQVERTERFGDEMDTFFEGVAPKFAFIADRGSATLNWRFADIGHREFTCYVAREREDGRVRGYLVTEILDLPEEGVRRGTVVDFLADPGDRAPLEALLDAADRQFRDAGVDFAVLLQTFPGFDPILDRWGYRKARRPGPVNQLLYLDRRSERRPAPGDSYQGWAITYGDSDAYLW